MELQNGRISFGDGYSARRTREDSWLVTYSHKGEGFRAVGEYDSLAEAEAAKRSDMERQAARLRDLMEAASKRHVFHVLSGSVRLRQ